MRLYHLTSEANLSFTERVIWSRLRWLADRDKGATRVALSAATGFHNGRTIPDALAKLTKLNLVYAKGRKYFATYPKDEQRKWFSFGKSGDKEILHYLFIIMPASGLSLREAVIYSQCRRERGTIRKLQRLLRLSPATICKYRRSLQEKGLLDLLYRAVIAPELLHYFQDAVVEEPKPKLNSIKYGTEFWHELADEIFPSKDQQIPIATGRQVISALDRHSALMAAAGYTRNQIGTFWDEMEKLTMDTDHGTNKFLVFVADFPTLFKEVDHDHKANDYKGTSAKLLRDNALQKLENPRFLSSVGNVYRFGGLVFL